VRFGRRAAIVEYALLLALAYAVPALLAATQRTAWLLLPLVTAPLAVARLRRLINAAAGPEFNALLAATGQLLLAHGLLFAAGLALAA
jgi:1,4-dihydroxy-2-naphthoate octaprenyltransferase